MQENGVGVEVRHHNSILEVRGGHEKFSFFLLLESADSSSQTISCFGMVYKTLHDVLG